MHTIIIIFCLFLKILEMSTLRPSPADEERYKTGEVSDDVYNATADYIKQVAGIFENLPEKVQRASSELLNSDQKTSADLTEIENMINNEEGNNIDVGKLEELVGGILEESCKVSQVNQALLDQLYEDEQTAELYVQFKKIYHYLLFFLGLASDLLGEKIIMIFCTCFYNFYLLSVYFS